MATECRSEFFTIGHSTRPMAEFLALLAEAEIALVVDVRHFPRSRTNPDYDSAPLTQTLAVQQIGYEHLVELGGLRGKDPALPSSVNAFWRNRSFHNYADYARSPAFQHGLRRLRTLGHERRTVIMCAEALWWRCHRRVIADYLLAAGEMVFHILGPGQIVPAQRTAAAARGTDGLLSYPGPVKSAVPSSLK